MKLEAIFYLKVPVSERGHLLRDRLVAPVKDIPGAFIDPHQFPELQKELEHARPAAEQKLVAVAKKNGLTPAGAPDISMSLYAGMSGPMHMTFSMRAQ